MEELKLVEFLDKYYSSYSYSEFAEEEFGYGVSLLSKYISGRGAPGPGSASWKKLLKIASKYNVVLKYTSIQLMEIQIKDLKEEVKDLTLSLENMKNIIVNQQKIVIDLKKKLKKYNEVYHIITGRYLEGFKNDNI